MPKERDDLTDDTVLANKALRLLRSSNTLAYAMLNMSTTELSSFGAIESAKTSNLPNGDTRLAWTNLEKLYKPMNNSNGF